MKKKFLKKVKIVIVLQGAKALQKVIKVVILVKKTV